MALTPQTRQQKEMSSISGDDAVVENPKKRLYSVMKDPPNALQEERDSKDHFETEGDSSAIDLAKEDLGHRYGNFHNYYTFHPPENRMEILRNLGVFQHIADAWKKKQQKQPNGEISTPQEVKDDTKNTGKFSYFDIGCNAGNLTMEIFKALEQHLKCPVDVNGMDIDASLIQRAKNQWGESGTFLVGNVMNQPLPLADLVSLLSTTMWIHVHHGDDGLEQALQRVCRASRMFVLVEVQPSKCYRNAMVRLRKLNRPPLDVSSEKLKMRPHIEQQVEDILQQNGFHLVNMHSQQERTQWNRALRLYQRRESIS